MGDLVTTSNRFITVLITGVYYIPYMEKNNASPDAWPQTNPYNPCKDCHSKGAYERQNLNMASASRQLTYYL